MKKVKSVYLYKIGRFQEDFEYLFPNIKVKKYITDDKRKKYKNIECINVKSLTNDIKEMIVICDRKNDEIIKTFRILGLKENINYMFLEDFGKLLDEKIPKKQEKINEYFKEKHKVYLKYDYATNSELFKKMIYTDPKYDTDCVEPFKYVQIQHNGYVYLCCAGWVTDYIGNLFHSTPKKIWNSNRAKIFRLSIINKTYCFCHLDHCRYQKKKFDSSNPRNYKLQTKKSPNFICIAFDLTCNLKCKSCRNHSINENNNKGYQYIYNNMVKKLFKSKWLSKTDVLMAASQGEVFFSKAYKKILDSKKTNPKDSLIIHTNGLLLNEEKINKLYSKYKNIEIYISLDSINEETYKNLRCGGNLNILKKNLSALSKAKAEGKIKYVSILCVLQNANYKELPEMAKYVIDLNFDSFDVTRIWNWNTYSDEEFKEISMYDDNQNPKPELVEILKNSIFNSDKIQFKGNVFKDK